MNSILKKQQRRKVRVRANIDSASLPRLSVYRSNKFIYAQIIDDTKRKTLAAVSDATLESAKGTKSERAKKVGQEIATLAKKAKVVQVVFDRGSYKYHGRVKQVAEGAREGGLKF